MPEIIKTTTKDGVHFSVIELNNNGIQPGCKVMIKKVNSSREYEIFLKLLGLWELLLTECHNQTGWSTEWWKFELKMRAGFGKVVDGPNNTHRFIPQSMAWDDSTIEQRSKLFRDSLIYLTENEVIDTGSFQGRYFEITGRCLI